MKILLGTKIGMTQMFDPEGRARGVTAVEIAPASVIRVKSEEKDGYEAVQLGAGERRNVGKAQLGQTGGKPYKVLKEFPKPTDEIKVGDALGIEQVEAGEKLHVTSTSKGKGFQGTVKRHNFSRGPKTHGSRNYRAPGSIGGTGAARVFPGQKMPGRMGNATVTTKNVTVAAVHADDNVVLLHGSVPGPTGSQVILRAV